MPKLPWTISKEKSTVHHLTGHEPSTSLVPSSGAPVRAASPSMLERLSSWKKQKENNSPHHGLSRTEYHASLVPRTPIKATGHLLDPSDPSHPPSSSIELPSASGHTQPPPNPPTSAANFPSQRSVSPAITDHQKAYPSTPAPVQLLNPSDLGDRPQSSSLSSPELSSVTECAISPPNPSISPAKSTGHVMLPHGSTSTSAHTTWKANIVKYSNATFKVLGELTGAPSVGSFIQEMEVGIVAAV
jgi:hypothetical protein